MTRPKKSGAAMDAPAENRSITIPSPMSPYSGLARPTRRPSDARLRSCAASSVSLTIALATARRTISLAADAIDMHRTDSTIENTHPSARSATPRPVSAGSVSASPWLVASPYAAMTSPRRVAQYAKESNRKRWVTVKRRPKDVWVRMRMDTSGSLGTADTVRSAMRNRVKRLADRTAARPTMSRTSSSQAWSLASLTSVSRYVVSLWIPMMKKRTMADNESTKRTVRHIPMRPSSPRDSVRASGLTTLSPSSTSWTWADMARAYPLVTVGLACVHWRMCGYTCVGTCVVCAVWPPGSRPAGSATSLPEAPRDEATGGADLPQ
eukprot:m.163791 g.163791  ORF g.163791 m.163791 type:complete len:323 (-) comp12339_c0_seq1:40-1008(-)